MQNESTFSSHYEIQIERRMNYMKVCREVEKNPVNLSRRSRAGKTSKNYNIHSSLALFLLIRITAPGDGVASADVVNASELYTRDLVPLMHI